LSEIFGKPGITFKNCSNLEGSLKIFHSGGGFVNTVESLSILTCLTVFEEDIFSRHFSTGVFYDFMSSFISVLEIFGMQALDVFQNLRKIPRNA